MPNILEDLYYGNLTPCQRAVRPVSKVQKLSQKRCDLESKLDKSFTEEQRETFEQYLSVSADLLDANCLDSFITGFASAPASRTKSSSEQTRHSLI